VEGEEQIVADTGAEGERPAWLPENFLTPEALAESYKQAMRKISEQGSQLHQLQDRLAVVEVADQLEPSFLEPVDAADFEVDETAEAVERARERRDLQASLALVPEFVERFTPQQVQPPPVQSVFAEAAARLAQVHPDFEGLQGAIAEEIKQRPGWITPDAASNTQAAEVALERIYSTVKMARSMELMKLDAQSASGAGGRALPVDPGTQRFAEIAGAQTRKYQDLFR
jgi:hypothetical protein